MDTSTHIIVGIGLGTLSFIDPVISAADSATLVYTATILGSNAPDVDYITKLKKKSAFYSIHRGFTHSLPMLPLLALLITICLLPFTTLQVASHLFLWTVLAVCIHVVSDVFNIHGTQALRPFTNKWIALEAIPLFDSFIFLLHIIGIGFSIVPTIPVWQPFAIIYPIIVVYYIVRFYFHRRILSNLESHFVNSKYINVLPSRVLWAWKITIETEDDFLFGSYSFNRLIIVTAIKKHETSQYFMLSKEHGEISNFLNSCAKFMPQLVSRKNGWEVRWIDTRFRKGRFFPFMGLTYFPHGQQPISYSGWFHTPFHYKKKTK
ncbi:metal-dependent hydrolase [Bacillus coahuilensis]|uniref:metal-dependent hydrolase n=1 Tax=Bacillus coahuilensis TaxID=408580 RepID=UPI0001850D09|nr:metal-dependent hydrolase [Bacillus coahuilensis]